MISPLQFARALQQALDYRVAGMSQIEAATQACLTVGISTDWTMIIQLTLDQSVCLANAWCERITEENLDRAYGNRSSFR